MYSSHITMPINKAARSVPQAVSAGQHSSAGSKLPETRGIWTRIIAQSDDRWHGREAKQLAVAPWTAEVEGDHVPELQDGVQFSPYLLSALCKPQNWACLTSLLILSSFSAISNVCWPLLISRTTETNHSTVLSLDGDRLKSFSCSFPTLMLSCKWLQPAGFLFSAGLFSVP